MVDAALDLAVDLDSARLENFHADLMSRGLEKANEAAYEEKERDRRRLKVMREENRTLWIHHHARMAEEFARLSADHARRAKVLEERMIDA